MTTSNAIVIDGNFLNRMGLASFLRREVGFSRVHDFASIGGAMDVIRNTGDIQLILLDSSLPHLAALGGIAGLRQQAGGAAVAIIDNRRDRLSVYKAIDEGAQGFLPRGLDEAQIRHAVEVMLQGYIFIPRELADFASPPSIAPAPPRDAPKVQLTERQREVLDHLADGKSNKEIARALQISESTVKVHVAATFRLLGVHNRVNAVAALRAEGKQARQYREYDGDRRASTFAAK